VLEKRAALGGSAASGKKGSKPLKLSDIKKKETRRISSHIGEFDRVLGGGFVPGQVTLIAGTPGVGKSTLLTQISKNMPEVNVLYVCGEESPSQIKVRTDRMGYEAGNLHLIPDTNIENAAASIQAYGD
jgi:DNA repair protein RadA/Sms